MPKKLKKALLILCVPTGLTIISLLWTGSSPDGQESSNTGISLVRPAFAQENGANFLEEEAGVTAYMNVGMSINPGKAYSAFRTVERYTADYIIGSVPLPKCDQSEDVHVFIHRDGWVAAYYMKGETAGKIVDWERYNGRGTKLYNALNVVAEKGMFPVRSVSFYDYRNPDANRMMIIMEELSSKWQSHSEQFKIRVPGEFAFSEQSYSHWSGTSDTCTLYIDGVKISSKSGTKYGKLSSTLLQPNVFHTINISVVGIYAGVTARGAIVLIYRES